MRRGNVQKSILNFIESNKNPSGPSLAILILGLYKAGKAQGEEFTEESVRRSLYNCRKKKYVKIVSAKGKGDSNFKLQLTKRGKKVLGDINFGDVKIRPPKKWDGNWRIIIFDVPGKYDYGRDILRDKLKRLGCFQFQQSVWVHPYPCKEEVRYILEHLGLEPYVYVFEGKLDRDSELRTYFKKKGINL